MAKRLLNFVKELAEKNIFYSLLFVYAISVFSMFGIQLYKNQSTADVIFEPTKVGKENNKFQEANNSYVQKLSVEISGAVMKPGVYELDPESRLIKLVSKAGGFSSNVSETWISKNINLASKLSDSQKVYIPFEWESLEEENTLSKDISTLIKSYGYSQNAQLDHPEKLESVGTENTQLTNVNTASEEDLDELPGIGPAYASRLIESRPYIDLDDLKEKSTVPESVLNKIQKLITF